MELLLREIFLKSTKKFRLKTIFNMSKSVKFKCIFKMKALAKINNK